jgi:hypothetical protein
VVRRFFEANDERIGRIIADAFPIFERFGWTLGDVDDMEFFDFCLVADGVAELNKRDAEAAAKARASRG